MVERKAFSLVERIDALLPQTQCRKCGFDGCRPYAEAIAVGEAPINRCPPGGADGIAELASLLDQAPLPLDPTVGSECAPRVALISEQVCIGCTLCIQACPVDAIVGAPKRMHTVLLVHCTGCELCLPPCPVDCIELASVATLARQQVTPALARAEFSREASAQSARARFTAHQQRTSHRPRSSTPAASISERGEDDRAVRRRAIQGALARARHRRAAG